MSALRGVLTGALGLAALQAVLSTGATSNLGTLVKIPGDAVRWWLSPTTPLIPDLRSDQSRSIGAAITAAYANGGAAGTASILPAVSTGSTAASSATQGLDKLPVTTTKPKIVFPPARPPGSK